MWYYVCTYTIIFILYNYYLTNLVVFKLRNKYYRYKKPATNGQRISLKKNFYIKLFYICKQNNNTKYNNYSLWTIFYN